jgi:glycosyltransferase involved in cell wall biosynthesis
MLVEKETPGDEILPLISIVIVTYNAESYLEECFASIFEQSFTNFELVVIDGNSTDKTLEIIRQFEDKIDYWQSEPDHGIYDAMNKSIRYCKGKWVFFLGSDDRLMSGFSAMAAKLINESTIYYGDCVTDLELYGGEFSRYRLAKRNICQQCVFYPIQIFNNYRFDTQYPVFADYLLNMQCWGDSRFRRKYLPYAIAYYNLNGFSSFANDAKFRKNKRVYVKKYLGSLVYLRYLIKELKRGKLS